MIFILFGGYEFLVFVGMLMLFLILDYVVVLVVESLINCCGNVLLCNVRVFRNV